ncbi:hypothetical protein ACJMK2_041374 [Sinanodonta woodiana]|uniref:Uncharacterized protein n=1 Tax=Sinanodonta woodiana TaxID=1069815 RepID=A0ABD3W793_SINWO
MFNPRYDYCFCSSCHTSRGDNKVYPRGNPPKNYILPLGWRRFGLNVHHIPKGFTTDEIFTTWHMAFHGTHINTLVSIWKIGFEIPGGKTAEGAVIKPWKGHFNYIVAPNNFDYEQIFVTPSPTYAGKAAYSHEHQFYDRVTQQSYDCHVALQVRIKPGSYDIGRETIGEWNIDPHVRDEEMEWSTKDRNAIMTTGLLVRMQ